VCSHPSDSANSDHLHLSPFFRETSKFLQALLNKCSFPEVSGPFVLTGFDLYFDTWRVCHCTRFEFFPFFFFLSLSTVCQAESFWRSRNYILAVTPPSPSMQKISLLSPYAFFCHYSSSTILLCRLREFLRDARPHQTPPISPRKSTPPSCPQIPPISPKPSPKIIHGNLVDSSPHPQYLHFLPCHGARKAGNLPRVMYRRSNQ